MSASLEGTRLYQYAIIDEVRRIDVPYDIDNPTRQDVLAFIDDTNFHIHRILEYAVDEFCPHGDASDAVSHEPAANLVRLLTFYANLKDASDET